MTAVETAPRRRVSILYGLGVLFLPFIFSWGLLRDGYSQRARVLGLGWMSVTLLSAAMHETLPQPTNEADAAVPSIRAAPTVTPRNSQISPAPEKLDAAAARYADNEPLSKGSAVSINQWLELDRAFADTSSAAGRCMEQVMLDLPLSYSRNQMIGAAKAGCAGLSRKAVELRDELPQGHDHRPLAEWEDSLANNVAEKVFGEMGRP